MHSSVCEGETNNHPDGVNCAPEPNTSAALSKPHSSKAAAQAPSKKPFGHRQTALPQFNVGTPDKSRCQAKGGKFARRRVRNGTTISFMIGLRKFQDGFGCF